MRIVSIKRGIYTMNLSRTKDTYRVQIYKDGEQVPVQTFSTRDGDSAFQFCERKMRVIAGVNQKSEQ